MKKFTTTFFLLMAMVLLLPTEMKAADVYLLCNADGAGWTTSNDWKFTPQSGDIYKLNVPASKINQNGNQLRFRVAVDGWRGQMCPKSGNGSMAAFDMATKIAKKEPYVITDECFTDASGSNAGSYFYFDKGTYDSYDITVSIGNTNKYIKVEGVTSGSEETGTGYYLYCDPGDGWSSASPYCGNSGNELKSVDGKYNVTFTIPSANTGKFYFCVFKGNSIAWSNAIRPESGSGTGSNNTATSGKIANSNNDKVWLYETTSTKDVTLTLSLAGVANGDSWTLTKGETTVTPPTPVTGKNIYFVGDLFDNQTAIDYNCRYFKMTDNGDNTYSIDLPATLTVKAQLLVVDGKTETVYGPNENGYGISNTWPSGNNGSVPDQPLAECTKNLTKYWTFVDRGLNSDGMYTLTVKLNDEGVPTTWSIKHDLLTRVAYFIANTEGATVYPAYSKRNNETASGNNKYFGSIYLPANTGCYVISNITKQSDSGNHDLRKTTKKFYLQGNSTGKSPATGDSKDTKVFPVQYNGSATTYKPFVFSETEGMQYLLEYNPTQGEDYIANNYGYVGGEVQVRKEGALAPLVVKSMKIVGPAIKGAGWDLAENALDMHYNVSENCWEVTFDTTASAGKVFRFVANDKWENSWQENSTEQAEIAKIPYDGEREGQPATVAVPNDVSYISSITSAETRNSGYDIIFNRNGGRWTVRFYIDTESSQGGNWFDYKFRYTINGTPTVNVPVDLTYRVDKFIRSFSYDDNLDLPADGSVKAYEAYRFKQGDKATKKHGTVYLRRIEYIPANMGVILVGEVPEGNGKFVDGNVKAFNLTKRTAGLVDKNEDLWTLKDSYKNDEWNNYLVGTVTAVNDLGNAEVVNGKVTKRYFGLGHYYATNEYKKTGVGVDYIGFFRYTANAISGANKAYLSIPTATDSKFGYIDFNGQWLDDNYDSPNASNDEISTLSKAGIIFDDIDFDETTAISNVNANEKNVKDGAYYTLQGIKVAKPTRGLYIHNGKKVIIK